MKYKKVYILKSKRVIEGKSNVTTSYFSSKKKAIEHINWTWDLYDTTGRRITKGAYIDFYFSTDKNENRMDFILSWEDLNR
jgi:hypothetical protein